MVFQDVSGSWRSPVWWWWYLLKLCMVRRSSVCSGPSFQCWWRHPTSITEMWNDMVICDSIKMSPVDDGSSSVLVMDEWYVMNGLFLHGMTSTIDDGCDWPWRWNIKMVWFGGAFKWWKLSSQLMVSCVWSGERPKDGMVKNLRLWLRNTWCPIPRRRWKWLCSITVVEGWSGEDGEGWRSNGDGWLLMTGEGWHLVYGSAWRPIYLAWIDLRTTVAWPLPPLCLIIKLQKQIYQPKPDHNNSYPFLLLRLFNLYDFWSF